MKKLLITGASAFALLASPAMALTAYEMGNTTARPLGTVGTDARVNARTDADVQIYNYDRTNTYGYDLSRYDRDSRRMVSMDELEQYEMRAAADARVASDATVIDQAGPKAYTGANVSFLTGGVSEGERARLEQEARNYDLKLVFAAKPSNQFDNNPYYSNIPVTIEDSAGNTVLSAVSSGPWFYADLPAGTYRVTAGAEGTAKTETVTVGNKGLRTLNYYW